MNQEDDKGAGVGVESGAAERERLTRREIGAILRCAVNVRHGREMKRQGFERTATRWYIALVVVAILAITITGQIEDGDWRATALIIVTGILLSFLGWFLGIKGTRKFMRFPDEKLPSAAKPRIEVERMT